MDLSTIKTSRGGVVSIHCGKQLTTNLWDRAGWYVITDTEAIKTLKNIAADEMRGLTTKVEEAVAELRGKHPTPTSIGYPYRRMRGSSVSATPAASTGTPPTIKEVIISTEKEMVTHVDLSLEEPDDKLVLKNQVCEKMIQFFSEFAYDISLRFMNTLAQQKSLKDAVAYINNYFALCDHPDKAAIADKIKSDEFRMIFSDLKSCKTSKKINNRLEIYYGPAGTGKTTQAINDHPGAAVTVCGATMDDKDLMKTFAFNDENGNPQFKPSRLQEDMVAGRVHILDEINLLPTSSLTYLQGILDGKKEIDFEGTTIKIADGFKVIGTMNLVVNGQTMSLPEPIVDRADVLSEFKCSAEFLAKCAL